MKNKLHNFSAEYLCKIAIDIHSGMCYNRITIKTNQSNRTHTPEGEKEGIIMKTIATIEELIQELESHKYSYYGLRGSSAEELEEVNNDGYFKECSSVWEDGTPTEEKLNGTCAVDVFDELTQTEIMARYNTAKKRYSADGTVLLIADSEQEYGNDESETILGHDGYGADVVAVVKL